VTAGQVMEGPPASVRHGVEQLPTRSTWRVMNPWVRCYESTRSHALSICLTKSRCIGKCGAVSLDHFSRFYWRNS